jgi:glycosyltransferase involved in cell wall biosynthesis
MNILIVSSSFYPKVDGSVRVVYDHARKLAENGHNVYLLTRKVDGSPTYEKMNSIHVIRVPPSFRRASFWKKVRLLLNQITFMFLLYRQVKFEIIHCHGILPAFSALPAKFVLRVPLVITTHGTELLWPSWCWWKSRIEMKMSLLFEKFVMSNVDCIIAQSKGVRDYMLKIYGGHLLKRIKIIPTGVDDSKFCRLIDQKKTLERPLILFVGALSKVKGVDTLIEATNLVLKKIPQVLLIIVGAGLQHEELEKLVERLRIKDSVIFQGEVADDDMLVELYNKASVVVLPSNVGGPVACTILEGMSVGKPVISTAVVGGIPDVIQNGENGMLVKPGDPNQLANAIIRLLTDNDLAMRMGDAARKCVEEKYSLYKVTLQLENLYKELAYLRTTDKMKIHM